MGMVERIKNQIMLEGCLNNMNVSEKEEVFLETAIQIDLNQWDELIGRIYKKYPKIAGYIDITSMINTCLETIPGLSMSNDSDLAYKILEDIAYTIADYVVSMCKIVNKYETEVKK